MCARVDGRLYLLTRPALFADLYKYEKYLASYLLALALVSEVRSHWRVECCVWTLFGGAACILCHLPAACTTRDMR